VVADAQRDDARFSRSRNRNCRKADKAKERRSAQIFDEHEHSPDLQCGMLIPASKKILEHHFASG